MLVGLGYSNRILASYGTIVNGYDNDITGSASFAFIGNGKYNYVIGSSHGAVVAGSGNTIGDSQYSFVGSGKNVRIANSKHSVNVGGLNNIITLGSEYSTIGGGSDHTVSAATHPLR